jgi:hypothetical protein
MPQQITDSTGRFPERDNKIVIFVLKEVSDWANGTIEGMEHGSRRALPDVLKSRYIY